MNPVAVMERVSLAWGTGDYPKLRKLLHPDGSWVFVSTDVRVFCDRDELVDAIRHAHERTSYKLYTVTHEQLGETVVLAAAYIRASVGAAGQRLGRHAFLCDVRDGLFFRSEYFDSEHEARAAFEAGWSAAELSSEDGLVALGVEEPILTA